MTTRTLRTIALAGALALGLAAGATAETIEGQTIVLEKDMAAQTLKVEPPSMTLHLSEKTVYLNVEGEKISLGDVPTAIKHPEGYYEVGDDVSIRYEGEMVKGKPTAYTVQLVKGNVD